MIQMFKTNWVDPGAWQPSYPANYGPGTDKSGPSGQRLYVIPGQYQGSTDGFSRGMISPPTKLGRSGSNAPTGSIGYNENAPKGGTQVDPGPQTPDSTGTSSNRTTGTGYLGGSPRQIQLAPIGNGFYLRQDAATAFLQMAGAARRAGITLTVNSAFRTYEQQQALYDRHRAGQGAQAA
jgi:hypothetical protein